MTEHLRTLKVADLHVSQQNCRKGVTKKSVAALAASIKEYGLLNPLTVCHDDDTFEVIAGQRRLFAIKSLGWDEVSCNIRDLDDHNKQAVSVAENTMRISLTPMQEAEAYEAMFETGKSIEETCEHFGVTRRYLMQRYKLAKLPGNIRKLVHKSVIDSETAATLTMASPDFLKDWYDKYKSENDMAPMGYALRRAILNPKIPTETAIFDIETYSGTITRDLFSWEGYSTVDDAYFDDASTFWEHQMAAVKIRADELGATIIHPDNTKWNSWDYREGTDEDGDTLSFIRVHADGGVTEHEGMIPRDTARAQLAEIGEAPKKIQFELSKASTASINDTLSLGIHDAIGKNFKTAMRYALGELLSAYGSVRADNPFGDDPVPLNRGKAHMKVADMDWKDVQKTLTTIISKSYDMLQRETMHSNDYWIGEHYEADAKGRFIPDMVDDIRNRRTLAHMMQDMSDLSHDTMSIDAVVHSGGKVKDMQHNVKTMMASAPDWQPVWMAYPPVTYAEIEATFEEKEAA